MGQWGLLLGYALIPVALHQCLRQSKSLQRDAAQGLPYGSPHRDPELAHGHIALLAVSLQHFPARHAEVPWLAED